MNRQIVTKKDVEKFKANHPPIQVLDAVGKTTTTTPTPPTQDDYLSRLVKHIPAEIVGAYLFVDGLVKGASVAPPQVLLWVVFVVLLICTPLYMRRVGKVTRRTELAVSTGSFAVWIFAIGGPFIALAWYNPLYGAVLMALYTAVLSPLITGNR